MLTLGIAIRLVGRLERSEGPWRRWLIWGFPGLFSLVGRSPALRGPLVSFRRNIDRDLFKTL